MNVIDGAQHARAEKLKAATDRLEAGIADLFNSDNYAAYLTAMSKFHRYSYGNVVLILSQFPEAGQVAGIRTWNKFGRTVKKGEHGIEILVPCTYTRTEQRNKIDPDTQNQVLDENGQPVREQAAIQHLRFKVGHVFDISQTEGREMPDIVCELSGDVAQYEAVCSALREVSPVLIEFGPLPDDVRGSYNHADQKIIIRPEMSQAQTVKTMIHEITHSKLHALPVEYGIVIGRHEKNQGTREVEAEGVAYVVCQHFGIDTSEYSFGYVAGWDKGKDMTRLKASLGCIRDTADEIIRSIETKCPELAPPEPEPEEKTPGPRRPKRNRRTAPARQTR